MVAREAKAQHRLVRALFNSGFGEGWALYAERVADEMGLYSGDLDRFGYLEQRQVPLGSHGDRLRHPHPRDELRRSDQAAHGTGNALPRAGARRGEPLHLVAGAGPSYMIGNLEILRLREAAKAKLGAQFDLRAFHDQVLGRGSVTLPLLRELVEDWIASPRRHSDDRSPARRPRCSACRPASDERPPACAAGPALLRAGPALRPDCESTAGAAARPGRLAVADRLHQRARAAVGPEVPLGTADRSLRHAQAVAAGAERPLDGADAGRGVTGFRRLGRPAALAARRAVLRQRHLGDAGHRDRRLRDHPAAAGMARPRQQHPGRRLQARHGDGQRRLAVARLAARLAGELRQPRVPDAAGDRAGPVHGRRPHAQSSSRRRTPSGTACAAMPRCSTASSRDPGSAGGLRRSRCTNSATRSPRA